MTTQEKAEKMLQEHKDTLNNEFWEQYNNEYDFSEHSTTVDGIRDLDIDSIDFNAGFEQGYLYALEHLLDNQ